MKIETSYQVNSNVYFIHEHRVHQGDIKRINTTTSDDPSTYVATTIISYEIEYKNEYGNLRIIVLNQDLVFGSKEDLINSL